MRYEKRYNEIKEKFPGGFDLQFIFLWSTIPMFITSLTLCVIKKNTL